MRLILFILIFLIWCPLIAQRKATEIPITLRRDLTDKRDVLPLISPDNNEIALILIDNNSVAGIFLDRDLKMTNEKEWARPSDGAHTELVGGFQNGDSYYVCFSNKTHSKLVLYHLNFKNDEIKNSNFELPSNEKYIGSFSLKDKWYLASIVKRTSTVKFYEFTNEKDFAILTFDFGSGKFDSQWPTLHYAISGQSLSSINVTVIDYESPKSLNQTHPGNKLYFYDSQAVLTVEGLQKTLVLTMNLTDGSYKKTEFKIPCEFGTQNSFLYSGKLFQTAFCDDYLSFRIMDVASKITIQEYAARKDETIYFKNSPIIQEGGGTIYSENREIEIDKTKQFFRKLGGGTMAITVFPTNNRNVEVILGSIKELNQPVGGLGVMNMQTPGVTPIYTNSYLPGQSFNTYTWSKTTYFKSLFDESSFEHVKGIVPETEFDKMKKFDEEKNNKVRTNFKFRGHYYYGFYDGSKKQYLLYDFSF